MRLIKGTTSSLDSDDGDQRTIRVAREEKRSSVDVFQTKLIKNRKGMISKKGKVRF